MNSFESFQAVSASIHIPTDFQENHVYLKKRQAISYIHHFAIDKTVGIQCNILKRNFRACKAQHRLNGSDSLEGATNRQNVILSRTYIQEKCIKQRSTAERERRTYPTTAWRQYHYTTIPLVLKWVVSNDYEYECIILNKFWNGLVKGPRLSNGSRTPNLFCNRKKRR